MRNNTLKKEPEMWFLCLMFVLSISLFFKADIYSEDVNIPDKKENQSAYDTRSQFQQQTDQNLFGVALYYPNYLMPFHYTFKPYSDYYSQNKLIPENSKRPLNSSEVKFQISFSIPVFMDIFDSETNLKIAYTQLSFWQYYTNDPYFRETNYQPEIFLERKFSSNFYSSLGAVHQSNGRGGQTERSWNRVYTRFIFSGSSWMTTLNFWYQLNAKKERTNPDIAEYLGYGNIIIAYKIKENVFSLESYNFIESYFKRPSVRLGWSYPVIDRLRLYFTYFHGYGQSMLEYTYLENSIGLGLSINDWI